jgi:hypothetical protein
LDCYVAKIEFVDKYKIRHCSCGAVEWYIDGVLHKDDGPAVESSRGNKFWYVHGILHRDGGPAVESIEGNRYWYTNGYIHREDGPAFIGPGMEEWRINGKLHREDGGPAVKYGNGQKEWWINGMRHREDGRPAVKESNNVNSWYIYSNKITKGEGFWMQNKYDYVMKIKEYYYMLVKLSNNYTVEMIDILMDKLEELFSFLSGEIVEIS